VSLAVAGGLGALTSAGGSIMSGLSGAANDKRQALAATTAAENTITATNIQAKNEGDKTGQLIGRQRAAEGASGGDVNSGSDAQVQQDAGGTGYRSITAILTNGSNVVVQDNAQAAGFDSQAASAMESGAIGAGASLLSGAASVGDKYLRWQQSNLPSPGMTANGAAPGQAYY
jgi:hypothetical protein